MANLNDILTSLQNGVQAIQTVAKNVASVFPQVTGQSTTIPSSVGGITYTSSQPKGFFLVTTSSGYTSKVPYY